MNQIGLRKLLRLIPFGSDISEITCITTTACNFKCAHCFMIDELNTPADELSADEMEKLGSSMPRIRRVHLGGGEPFVRPEVTEKALVAVNHWGADIVCMPTNGWYTKNILKTIEAFGENGRGQLRLQFSMNTLPEDMAEFVQVKGAFERWRESIRSALELSTKYENVTVLALITYNEVSQEYFPELKRYLLEEVGIEDLSLQVARDHDTYHPDLQTDGFMEVVRDYFRNESKQPWFLRSYRELIRAKTDEFKHNPGQAPACASGRARLVIAPDGDVYPCEGLGYPNGDRRSEWFMGNVREFDLDMRQLLASRRAKQVQEKIASGNCRCEHGIDMSLNLLSSPVFQAKVVVHGLMNAFTRRLQG